jgi:hypothetical protein
MYIYIVLGTIPLEHSIFTVRGIAVASEQYRGPIMTYKDFPPCSETDRCRSSFDTSFIFFSFCVPTLRNKATKQRQNRFGTFIANVNDEGTIVVLLMYILAHIRGDMA